MGHFRFCTVKWVIMAFSLIRVHVVALSVKMAHFKKEKYVAHFGTDITIQICDLSLSQSFGPFGNLHVTGSE